MCSDTSVGCIKRILGSQKGSSAAMFVRDGFPELAQKTLLHLWRTNQRIDEKSPITIKIVQNKIVLNKFQIVDTQDTSMLHQNFMHVEKQKEKSWGAELYLFLQCAVVVTALVNGRGKKNRRYGVKKGQAREWEPKTSN